MSTCGVLIFCAVFISCSLVSVNGGVYSRTVSYNNEVLIKCSKLEAGAMKLLEGADIWRVDASGSVTFRIAISSYRQLRENLAHCEELGNVEDIVRRSEGYIVKRSGEDVFATRANKSLDWFDEYHDLQEITNWWKELADDNELVTYFNIGQSYEGRDVFAVNITASPDPDIPSFYFQCLIHSREWISGAMCMYVVNEMIEQYKAGNEGIKNILEKNRLIFVPVVNPDGYVHTWTTNRLWRKNMHPTPGSTCIGVDLNRNYDDHWAEGGSSGNPCSDTYHGESAASEIEIKNVENLFLSIPKILGAMDWHSYSQLILRPWGWTPADSPDEDRLKAISQEMAARINAVHNKTYEPIKIIQLTLATGGSIDWFYSDAGNAFNEYRAAGLAFELRDTGDDGFLLPPAEIIPNGEEIYPAVLYFIEDLIKEPLNKE